MARQRSRRAVAPEPGSRSSELCRGSAARRGRRAARWTPVAALVLCACRGGSDAASYSEAEARAFLGARGFAVSPQELVRAVREGALDVVMAGLAAGIDPDAMEGRPLALAAASGQIEILEALLDAGAEPDHPGGSFGQTPLVTAVLRGQRRAVEVLLAAGAEPNASARGGASALHFVKDTRTASLLLDRGASVDVRDSRGATPLQGAVVLGDLRLVDLLLEHGADPNAADDVGRTALLYAGVYRFAAIEDRLLAAGATGHPRPELGVIALESYAGRYGDQERPLYQILVERGGLVLVQTGVNGLLSASDLVPLTATRFYRAGDPGLVLFEVRIENGRVTGLSRLSGSGWTTVARMPDAAPQAEDLRSPP
jgi:hypothetical protein